MGKRRSAMRNRWWAVPALVGGAALMAACGTSTPSGSAPASTPPATHAAKSAPAGSVTIMTRSTKLGTVLTTAAGKTIYWFVIDTPTKSNCTGTCATYWPPVLGTPAAASGTSLPHGFGTITRSGGVKQATYDGHPLYTYAGDTAAGQVNGNGKNLSGGLWWAMTPSGAKPSASGSSGSSGSGY
jgi:predicted lipoprotein with Yx(FWY)xxD motif